MSDLASRVFRLEDAIGKAAGAIERIDERLKHLPTKADLWRSVAVGAGAVIVALWAVIMFLVKPWVVQAIQSAVLTAKAGG